MRGSSTELLMMQALETEEARAARRKRVAEKLSSYKKQAGLVVDPAAEAAAQEAYNVGQELMREVGWAPCQVALSVCDVTLTPARTGRPAGEHG